MIHYESTKAMICLSNGDTNFFDIITGFLQEDISTPMKENYLTLKRQQANDVLQKLSCMQTIYIYDQVFLANTQVIKYLLHSLEQAASMPFHIPW